MSPLPKKRRWNCVDCKREDPPMVMLKEDLWLSIANKKEILCFSCIEKRLARLLVPDDLKDCSLTEEMKIGHIIFSRKQSVLESVSDSQ